MNKVKISLLLLFLAILTGMIGVTTYASLDRGITQVGTELLSDPWFHATLVDAYFGFLTFYAWVFYRERGILARSAWFVSIMLLGNIAMSLYMLGRLHRWDPDKGMAALLLRDSDNP